ncbi:MAG: hypothetical protein AAF702_50515 [Chloroflexota bacterium]
MIQKTHYRSTKRYITIKLIFTIVLSLALTPFLLGPFTAKAQVGSAKNCRKMIAEHVEWAKRGNGMVDSQLVSIAIKNRNPNIRLKFGFGRWGFARLGTQGDSLHGFYQEYFSDRTKGRQPFYWKSDDWLEATISPKNGVTIKLLSWGNATAKLRNLSCTNDGFIIGRWPGRWDQVVTIALVKTYR